MSLLTERNRDIAGGLLLALIGAGAAARTGATLGIGSLADMGPGFFPIVLSICLSLCGLAIALPAWLARTDAGETRRIDVRALLCIALSVSVLLVLVAGLGDVRTRIPTLALLAVGLGLLSWAIFILGLRMPLAAFNF